MGRAWRIEYDNALYHLISRGNGGQPIFLSDDDRQLFLNTISQMSERFEVEVFAYVLMTNHYHLLVKTHRANLKKAMQWFGTAYTQRFNNRNQKSGHLFQGRYKSILVQNDAYLTQLSCYIHRNPLRAGMVKRLIDYKWSSYPVYAYGKKGPSWLSTRLILSYFKGAKTHQQYRGKVQKYSEEEKKIMEDLHHGMILGTKAFVMKIRKMYLPDSTDDELPQQKQLAKDINVNDLIASVAKYLRIDMDKYVQAKRLHGVDKQTRDLIVYFIWNKGLMTNEKIGRCFGMSFSAVSHSVKSFKEEMDKNKKVKRQLYKLNSQFYV